MWINNSEHVENVIQHGITKDSGCKSCTALHIIIVISLGISLTYILIIFLVK